MKKIIQDWIWKFLGYGCCRPVHQHTINNVLKEWGERVNKSNQDQLHDLRAQLFEYFQQQEANNKDKIVKVQIIKND